MPQFTFFKRYLLSLLVLNLAACSTLQPVSIENAMQYSPPRGIDYGSLVEVKTLDKRTVKFRVTEITDDGLGASRAFFPLRTCRACALTIQGRTMVMPPLISSAYWVSSLWSPWLPALTA